MAMINLGLHTAEFLVLKEVPRWTVKLREGVGGADRSKYREAL